MESFLITFLPVVVGGLLLVSALLAASETALFALTRMEHTREQLSAPVRDALDRLMRRPLESLIVAIGLNEASNVFAECLGTIFFLTWLGPLGGYVAVPVMFILVLLFCDITPKTFALGFPGGIAIVTARPLAELVRIVHPITRPFVPAEEAPRPEPVSESEFKALLRLGENLGEVEPSERAMINRVFEFAARRVSDIMTPRDRIFMLDIATPPDEIFAQVIHGHFSRVPIFRGSPENIVGVLNAKDLVGRRLDATPPRIDRIIRPTVFVPPGKPLGELFDEIRRERVWMALVVDEFGKLLGLVTLEDVLEELFGEIRDEFDLEGPELTKVDDHEWLVSGGIDIKRLRDELGDGFVNAGGARTLSSLILRTLRRVPRAGESVKIGDFDAIAERVRGATIEQVRLAPMIIATVGVILAVIACIMLQAFSAASEIALVSADEAKMQAETESGGRLAAVLGKVLQNRDRLLALVLTTNNLATVMAAALLTSFLHGIRPRYALWAPFILAPLTLILGESIPKMLALRRSEDIARIAARPLSMLATILRPLLAAETALSGLLRRIVGVPSEVESVFVSREDLQLLLERRLPRASGPQRDAILPLERRMISRIFRFADAEARKAMVPLVQVLAMPEDTRLDAAIELLRREGHSRIPVFRSRITDLVGVVHVFDLLEAPDLSAPVSEVMRPVSYFPESMPLDEVLLAMQRTREHLSVIVDEYGGASGILTVEDLLEEIVGAIEDEYDDAERLTRIVNNQTLRVMARAPVTELNERFGLKLPEADEYATIGGLVVERLGHIPKPGEQLKAGDITVTVLRSDARAVREVMLHLGRPLRSEYTRRE